MEAIDGLVKKAELQSPSRPLRGLISKLGFKYDQISKRVLERIEKADAMDNPMNYFYDKGLFRSQEIPDFKGVFTRSYISTPPPSVRFLRQFVGARLDLGNQGHLSTLWWTLNSFAARGGPFRRGTIFISSFESMSRHMGYSKRKRGDLVAACLQNDEFSRDTMFQEMARRYRVPTLLSSYFKPRMQHFGYDLFLDTIHKLQDFDSESFGPLVKPLWEHAHAIAGLIKE